MNQQWHILEKPHPHIYIKNDFCIYAREYKPGQGYAWKTNSLIYDFKKPPSKKKTKYEWKYRQRAIHQFKTEIEQLLKMLHFKDSLNFKTFTITAIPSSRIKKDPEYDNRFEDLFNLLTSQSNLPITCEWPVEMKDPIQPAHVGGSRSPAYLKQHFTWKGFQNKPPQRLFIIDDILTSGAHFRAMSDFLKDENYNGQIIGIFWARTIRP